MASPLRRSAILLAAFLLLPAATAAAQQKQRVDSTVRYLQQVQHKDGGFGQRGSNPTDSVWAALALASAGINPRDQRKPGGQDVYTYLVRNPGRLTQSTEYSRLILVARAAGTSPERFGRVDLVKGLLGTQRRDGGFAQPPTLPSSQINGTAYAILALAGLEPGSAATRSSRDRALQWLLGKQLPNGAWQGTDSEESTDLTGSVLEALNAAGRRNTPAQARALAYLRSRQNADGGFGRGEEGGASNSASTAWVLRGLAAARQSPRSFQAAGTGKTPLEYLASMQQTDGSVRYSATDDSGRLWTTAFTTPALAGTSLPIAEVARSTDPEARTPERDETPPTRTRGDDGTQPGAGGVATGGDGEVTAGGGGEGAPLYSRPQPGSLGVQPGGDRDTDTPSRASGQGEGEVAGESIAGKLVGTGTLDAAGKGRSLGSAPGLRAAAAGGQAPTWLVAAIAVALALSALAGIHLERRGIRKEDS